MTEPLLTIFGGVDAETAVWAVVALVFVYYAVVAMLARRGERQERDRSYREGKEFALTLKRAQEIDERPKT